MSDEERVTKPFKFVTGVDARFPNTNQTKHCWQNYVDYHKCILAKGEDFAPCRQFWLAYRSLCPSGWYERWDAQRGKLPVSFPPLWLEKMTDIPNRGWQLPRQARVSVLFEMGKLD
uniref:Cytochrome c oxidase subunit 12, mitochondrial n=1 Tax=Podospora anserina (strain S / ATCC MYA-4624 / DSM 980 / FGSC 10383) TaxID=515849 RepID=A0A090D6E8_PODAN|nr:Putative Cytochrome c oxidase polypeptide VIb [Podospora anserina S mat+]